MLWSRDTQPLEVLMLWGSPSEVVQARSREQPGPWGFNLERFGFKIQRGVTGTRCLVVGRTGSVTCLSGHECWPTRCTALGKT